MAPEESLTSSDDTITAPLGPIAAPHFTYKRGDGDLQQGDVLAKSPGICEILRTVHPHYLKPDYTHFIVLSQSCDLVRRKNDSCSARYLTLAAVRPLSLLLKRELEQLQSPFATHAGVCSKKLRFKLEQFLDRLLNNNNPDYFYLNPEPQLSFPEAGVAFLRLSIALRAREHYKTCLSSRLLSLTDVFQAKLGWLVGSSYSQVGTEEWVPQHRSEVEQKQFLDSTIDGVCRWVMDDQLSEAYKSLQHSWEGLTREDLRSRIDASKPQSKKNKVFDRISCVLNEFHADDLSLGLTPEKLKKLISRLNNDPGLSSLLK